MERKEYNSLEMKNIIRYYISNNVELGKSGKSPIAIEIEGMPGIAKTAIVKQVASEFDHHYIRLNLSELEVCDLIGLPIYEYRVVKGDDIKWVTDKVLNVFSLQGYTATGEVRTSYAKPQWIQGKEDKPIILNLDDYNRITPMMSNACMTLIVEQRYSDWQLPEGSTVVMTCNPNDQDFFVQAEDSAQKTRRMKYLMKADVDTWASEYAEKAGVDGRCINFLLKHPEIIEGTSLPDKDGKVLDKGNLRLWSMYFDTISGIKDFNSSLDLVINLGGESIPQEHILIFGAFIKTGLDKLPTPADLIKGEFEKSIEKLRSCILEGPNKRQDIAAVLTKRLYNYAIANEKDLKPEHIENYALILESGHLSPDLTIITARNICMRQKFKDIAIRPGITKIITQ